VVSLYRTVRGGPGCCCPALALGLGIGVVVRAVLLALILTADFDVVARYLLPGYEMVLCFAVVGVAAGLPPVRPRESSGDEVSGSRSLRQRWRRPRTDRDRPPSG
jgi:hypothetical protein